MKRRTIVTTLLAAPLAAQQRAAKAAIQLHTDLEVKPGEAEKLVADFHAVFLPLIRKAPGFIDAKLLRFRRANVGSAPERYNYRLVQIFESEEQREKWTVAPGHKKAWHEAIESHVKTPFVAYLYDIGAELKPTRT